MIFNPNRYAEDLDMNEQIKYYNVFNANHKVRKNILLDKDFLQNPW